MLVSPVLPTTGDAISFAPATPKEALQQLIDGNARFLSHTARKPNQSLNRLTQLSSQQAPFATLISCSDSRVPPEIVFDQGIGDLFSIRVAGNIISPTQMGSCEYGVITLKTKLVVVLGHSECGAIKAALGNQIGEGSIGSLIEAIQPSVQASATHPGDRTRNTVRANVISQTQQLIASPAIARQLDVGAIYIVGAYFDIASGRVDVFNVVTQSSSSIQPNATYVF